MEIPLIVSSENFSVSSFCLSLRALLRRKEKHFMIALRFKTKEKTTTKRKKNNFVIKWLRVDIYVISLSDMYSRTLTIEQRKFAGAIEASQRIFHTISPLLAICWLWVAVKERERGKLSSFGAFKWEAFNRDAEVLLTTKTFSMHRNRYVKSLNRMTFSRKRTRSRFHNKSF